MKRRSRKRKAKWRERAENGKQNEEKEQKMESRIERRNRKRKSECRHRVENGKQKKEMEQKKDSRMKRLRVENEKLNMRVEN